MMEQTSNTTDFFKLDFPLRELKVCEEGTIANAKIVKDKNLAEKISDYRFLVTRLCSCAHKDMLKSTLPMGFMNIDYGMHEVERDLKMSLTLAYFYCPNAGFDVNTLKPAFYLLRSAIEGTKTCIYYYQQYKKSEELNSATEPIMDKWLRGVEDTPRTQQLNKIFKENNFDILEKEIHFKESLEKHKKRLEDILHSKIRVPEGYRPNQRNLFEYYLTYYFAVIMDITIMLTAFKPVNIVELPIDEKFGGNPPLILDDLSPVLFRKLIPAKILVTLDKIAEQDLETQSLKEFVLSQPDLTKEEIDKSFDYLDGFSKKPTPAPEEMKIVGREVK